MRLVSIGTTLFDKYKNAPEILTKSQRPYILVIRLKYNGKNCDFAVPIRSNIPAATASNKQSHAAEQSTLLGSFPGSAIISSMFSSKSH